MADTKITRARVSRYNNYLKVNIKPVKFTGVPQSGCYPGLVLSKAGSGESSVFETSAPRYNVQYVLPQAITNGPSSDEEKVVTSIIDAEWWNPHFVAEIPKNTTCHVFIIVNPRSGKQRFFFTIDQFTSIPV